MHTSTLSTSKSDVTLVRTCILPNHRHVYGDDAVLDLQLREYQKKKQSRDDWNSSLHALEARHRKESKERKERCVQRTLVKAAAESTQHKRVVKLFSMQLPEATGFQACVHLMDVLSSSGSNT